MNKPTSLIDVPLSLIHISWIEHTHKSDLGKEIIMGLSVFANEPLNCSKITMCVMKFQDKCYIRRQKEL